MAKNTANILIDCITKHSRRKFFEQGFYAWYRLGTVLSVASDNLTCKVDCGNIIIDNVKLCLKDADDTIIVKPAQNSIVIIEDISGGKQQEYRLLQTQKIEDIIINNLIINSGKNYGLVKIEELQKKLNDFEKKFNQHTHSLLPMVAGTIPVTGGTMQNGVPVSGTMGASSTTGISTNFQNQVSHPYDYENEKIKH